MLKAKISFSERELAGLMMIKRTGDGNYKIAFFNELGMTYFEGMLDPSSKHDKFIVNSIAPVINYKLFLKNFEKCMLAVLSEKKNACKSFTQMAPDNNKIITKLHNGFKLELTPN